MTSKTEPVKKSQTNTGTAGWPAAFLLSPLVLAGGMVAAFYSLLPHLPVYRELATRYFSGHPLGYIETSLFFLGIAILCRKGLSLFSQRKAFTLPLTQVKTLGDDGDTLTAANQILARVTQLPQRLQQTFLLDRIANAIRYVESHDGSENLHEHQQHLSDVAAERLHGSYALVRTISWAVPIVGFLGTVMGLTIAIANLQAEQLDSMAKVTAGLGIAFDTTTLALGLTLVLVFLSHFMEQCEQQLLNRTDDLAFNRIDGWFSKVVDQSPLQLAEQQAADHLLEQTEMLVNRQTTLWHDNLEEMRLSWQETIVEQQNRLARSLNESTADTVVDHALQLREMRNEFLESLRNVSQEMAESMAAHHTAIGQQQTVIGKQLDEQRAGFQHEASLLRDRMQEDAQQLAEAVTAAADNWQETMQSASAGMSAQLDELKQQSEVLLKIVAEEENLTRLQSSLSDNLQAVRTVEAFDETLHSLSAVVHLLTVRTKAA